MKLNLDWHPRHWSALIKELEPFRNDSILIDMLVTEVDDLITPFTYKALCKEFMEFLIANNLDPTKLPTVRKFHEFEGGAGVVKRAYKYGKDNFERQYKTYLRQQEVNPYKNTPYEVFEEKK